MSSQPTVHAHELPDSCNLGTHGSRDSARTQLAVVSLCIGCGQDYDGQDCLRCSAAISGALLKYEHWPLEATLTAAALTHVELAFREYLDRHPEVIHPARTELLNIANTVRAYFQHTNEVWLES